MTKYLHHYHHFLPSPSPLRLFSSSPVITSPKHLTLSSSRKPLHHQLSPQHPPTESPAPLPRARHPSPLITTHFRLSAPLITPSPPFPQDPMMGELPRLQVLLFNYLVRKVAITSWRSRVMSQPNMMDWVCTCSSVHMESYVVVSRIILMFFALICISKKSCWLLAGMTS